MAVPIFFYFYWVFSIFPLTLHIFVTSFIILQRHRKNKTYTSPFYLIYVFASFADIGNIINSNFMNRFTKIDTLQPWFRSHTLYITICYLISGYCLYSQAIFHAAVAINRVWVSWFLLKPGRTVLGQIGNYLIWVLPIVPVLCLSPSFPYTMVYFDLGPDVFFAIYGEAWVSNYHYIVGPTIVLSSSGLSFILTILTILRYRNLLKETTTSGAMIKREIYLMGHATVTLFFEILVGCYFGCVIVSNTYNLPGLFALVAPIVDYIIDISSMVNPVALLIICKFVRDDFKDFLFKLFPFLGNVSNKVIDISGEHRS